MPDTEASSLPATKQTPNSLADLLNPDGSVKQRRYYDADVYLTYTAKKNGKKYTGKLLWQAKKYKAKKCVDLTQLVKEYRVKLLLYQKGYYEIDSDENARLPQGEMQAGINHMKQVIRFYLQQVRTITEYVPESFETLAGAENLREEIQASVWYIQGKKPELHISCYFRFVSEEVK